MILIRSRHVQQYNGILQYNNISKLGVCEYSNFEFFPPKIEFKKKALGFFWNRQQTNDKLNLCLLLITLTALNLAQYNENAIVQQIWILGMGVLFSYVNFIQTTNWPGVVLLSFASILSLSHNPAPFLQTKGTLAVHLFLTTSIYQ